MPKEDQQGIVLSMLHERGYGFITPQSEEGREIFFHESACPDWAKLIPGDVVTYKEVNSKKGARALNVCKLKTR